MENFLQTKYTNVIAKPEYIIAEGNIPVALVAHADTVLRQPPKSFYYDAEQSVLWASEGLGADDRAGIYAIIKILKTSKLRPHIIITTGEEIGCVGAAALTSKMPQFPWELKFLIQLDRRGERDAIFYECGNEDFKQFISLFDFDVWRGPTSFSDISELGPAWDTAAVNFSIGYYNEHTRAEYLNLRQMNATIKKVKFLLDYVAEHPELEKWDYQNIALNRNTCAFCGCPLTDNDYINYRYENDPEPIIHSMCQECYDFVGSHVIFCDECYQVWLTDEPHKMSDRWICPECKKNKGANNEGKSK